jgi:hypothetical protein
MECDYWASYLAHTFISPYFGRKPKVKVATFHIYQIRGKTIYAKLGEKIVAILINI